MSWLIGQLLGDLWPYLAGGVVAAAALFTAWWRGGRNVRQKAATEALRDNIKTRERIDDAPVTSDPAVAFERLRDRDPDKR